MFTKHLMLAGAFLFSAFAFFIVLNPQYALVVLNQHQNTELANILNNATRIEIYKSPWDDTLLFETADQAEVDSFVTVCTIVPPRDGMISACNCSGSPHVKVYRQNELLLELTNHHGKKIRSDLWTSDESLASPIKWQNWFSERHIRWE